MCIEMGHGFTDVWELIGSALLAHHGRALSSSSLPFLAEEAILVGAVKQIEWTDLLCTCTSPRKALPSTFRDYFP